MKQDGRHAQNIPHISSSLFDIYNTNLGYGPLSLMGYWKSVYFEINTIYKIL